MLAFSLPIPAAAALIWTATVATVLLNGADGGAPLLAENNNDTSHQQPYAANYSSSEEAAAAMTKNWTATATAGGNLSRMMESGVEQSNCFYFCPTLTNMLVIGVVILLFTFVCAAIAYHQPREIWYVVDRSGEAQRVGGQPPMPPKMMGPSVPHQHQQMRLQSP
ncbi:hypothetical protein V9T40_004768 [Parthenolecanium corni]|uniref:Membrane-associated protein n=1 Tax=Parthenolecanium corni TaxID=536013 RepID=A0AAN9TCY9_9HEMI